MGENNGNVTEPKQEEPKKQYDVETLKLMHGLAKAEYDAEVDRFSVFQVRTGILLAFTGAMAPTMVKFFAVPDLKMGLNYAVILSISEIASIVMALLGGFFLFNVFKARSIERIKIEGFITDDNMFLAQKQTLFFLIATYRDTTVATRVSTDIKVKLFQRGLTLVGVSLIIALLAAFLSTLPVGRG